MTPWLERELSGWPMLTNWRDGAVGSSFSNGMPAHQAPRSAILVCSGRLVSRLVRCGVWLSGACDVWLEVLGSSGSWHEQTGSLHLAYRDDEAQVLREFALESRNHGEPFELLGPAAVADRARAVVQDGLQLALGSRMRSLRGSPRSRRATAGLAFTSFRRRVSV